MHFLILMMFRAVHIQQFQRLQLSDGTRLGTFAAGLRRFKKIRGNGGGNTQRRRTGGGGENAGKAGVHHAGHRQTGQGKTHLVKITI